MADSGRNAAHRAAGPDGATHHQRQAAPRRSPGPWHAGTDREARTTPGRSPTSMPEFSSSTISTSHTEPASSAISTQPWPSQKASGSITSCEPHLLAGRRFRSLVGDLRRPFDRMSRRHGRTRSTPGAAFVRIAHGEATLSPERGHRPGRRQAMEPQAAAAGAGRAVGDQPGSGQDHVVQELPVRVQPASSSA